MAQYIIQEESLTAIADAIRAKKETTAVFTPEQMATEIESIASGDDLPNAEDVSFGTVEQDKEYGVYSFFEMSSSTAARNLGNVFTANEDFAVSGFRFKPDSYSYTYQIILFDANTKTEIVSTTVTPSVTSGWVEVVLETPINLASGGKYMIYISRTDFGAFGVSCGKLEDCSVNPKITMDKYAYYSTSNIFDYPTIKVISNNDFAIIAIDIIVADTLTESVVTEYKIQKETLDNLAEAVKAQTGKVGKLTPAQMLTALQSITLQDKTVTPTAEVQTVTPDDGYYALSSVTVEAIPTTE